MSFLTSQTSSYSDIILGLGIETSVETRLAQLEELLANRSEERIDHSIETRLGSLEIKLSTVTAAITVVTKELSRHTKEFYQVRINSVPAAATCDHQ